MKLHPRIFLRTLKLLNTVPQSAVMVGGPPLSDIIGAKMGLNAILINRKNISKEDIYKLKMSQML